MEKKFIPLLPLIFSHINIEFQALHIDGESLLKQFFQNMTLSMFEVHGILEDRDTNNFMYFGR